MIRPLALAFLLCLPGMAGAGSVADQAAKASADLQAAVAALDQATEAKDRVAALTQTIRAYEDGLAALREALRQAELRETTLTLAFQAKRGQLSQLIGVLGSLDAAPGPLLLLHPSGPLGTVRSGMILADVTPALQAEAEKLRADLTELNDLRGLQEAAGRTLADGMGRAQAARTALSQAISERAELPRRFTDDPEVLKGLLQSADTLDAFAAGLTVDAAAPQDFASLQGSLPLPVLGRVLLRPGETDAAGATRPGLTLTTRPLALVTAPSAATIRYLGPLLSYGNVMILEPGGGYLLILAGLDTVYGELGQVVPAGAPLGLMGGSATDATDILSSASDQGGAGGSETLYLELRQGARPIDPTDWFAATKG